MQIKIISFNIWDLPLWFVKKRKERIAKVAQYLASSEADIICIQEAWSFSGRKMLIDTLGQAGYVHVVAREAPLLVGNSGMITFSKFPIIYKKFTPFSRLSSALVELFTAKGVLETIVQTPLGELSVFNTHLHMPSRLMSQKIRLRQMRKLLPVIAASTNPAILAGDFNEDKLWEQKEFTTILSAAHFSNPLSVEKGMPPTYRLENEFVDIWINRDTFARRYDYIFIRGLNDLGVQVRSYEPVYLTPALSDHDVVSLVLSSD